MVIHFILTIIFSYCMVHISYKEKCLWKLPCTSTFQCTGPPLHLCVFTNIQISYTRCTRLIKLVLLHSRLFLNHLFAISYILDTLAKKRHCNCPIRHYFPFKYLIPAIVQDGNLNEMDPHPNSSCPISCSQRLYPPSSSALWYLCSHSVPTKHEIGYWFLGTDCDKRDSFQIQFCSFCVELNY